MNKYAEFSKLREPNLSNRKCLTKQYYRTEEKAELMAAHIMSVLGERQIPYRCPMCFKWHLTSKVQEHHDFRDRNGKPDVKNYGPHDWRSWETNQQPEHMPGMGRR